MSDFNVKIVAVDEAIDMLDRYRIELSDIYACGLFDIDSTEELIRRKCVENQSKIDWLQNSSYESESQMRQLQEYYRKQELFEALREKMLIMCDKRRSDWSSMYRNYMDLIGEGKRIMLEYIVKMNKITLPNSWEEYHVIILDSKRYPQTADHIRWAIKKGMPEFVTLGRDAASQRRKESLKEIKRSPIYDRDEWPMACFQEGGSGADVFYVEGADNKGAGASIARQMEKIPDGSRVRIRII